MKWTKKLNLLFPIVLGFGIWAVVVGRIPWETLVLVILAGSSLDISW